MTDLSPEDFLDDDGFYNPLNEENLARGVADALTGQKVHPLRVPIFEGSGIYAIYYIGNVSPYEALGRFCAEGGNDERLGLGPQAVPIYVGKSSAGSGRRGKLRAKGNRVLYERINDHRRSIMKADGLDPNYFRVRYLRLRDVWVPLGEAGLLQRFVPLWNVVLDGFGNNSPGEGRKGQKRSTWDTLHPGRPSAMKLPGNEESVASIKDRLFRAITAIVNSNEVPEDALIVEGGTEVGVDAADA